MPENDYGVVIGIKDYPAFDAHNPLLGPENDAQDFYNWVTKPNGGGVPIHNVKLILTRDYGPPFPTPGAARPMVMDIQSAFEDLQTLAERNEKAGNGYRVGRRLYIYMSGHGFAPTVEDTGLLMANATPDKVGAIYHILGRYTADWFFKARCFEEVFLFMDCCREVFTVQGLNKSFSDQIVPGAIGQVKRFYGLATMWSGLAREVNINGKRRGVFTNALVRGLEGAACNASGKITALSLKNYIYSVLNDGNLNGAASSNDLSLGPEISFFPDINEGFTITETPLPEFAVNINVAAAAIGKKAEIMDGSDGFRIVEETDLLDTRWTVNLKRGKYLAQVLATGVQKIFSVDGTGGFDVDLS